jgi:hypothetical protein
MSLVMLEMVQSPLPSWFGYGETIGVNDGNWLILSDYLLK